ncbi:energy transducer TonB [Temperatibacter marinus]|uniref:Energy transducer TonB n=1 Tax=Temperatibacter marinus TaxID=1456591 RepID=A0AA52EHP2_9PROT|nr:energy transducer TonB [Temperatibacter marinus]WND02504.1 energy transducer TonB [Temperatibacter marinus]
MNKMTKLLSASTIALGLATTAVSAGEETVSVSDWQAKASAELDRKMVYSTFAQKYNDEGTVSYRVTIDSEGEIQKTKLLRNTGRGFIRQSALKSIKKTDFPALPSSYGSNEMTFRVDLNYMINPTQRELKELGLKIRNGRVTSERLASSTIRITPTKTGR